MGQEELAQTTPATNETSDNPGGVSWFRREHPHFFRPHIVAARNGGLPTNKEPLFQEAVQDWRPITRKLGRSLSTGNRTTFVDLRINQQTRAFSFTSKLNDMNLPVEREVILNAVASGHNGEWVGIPLGTEVLRLKRSELKVAFHTLDKLPR